MVTFFYTRATKEYASRINVLKAPERESIVDVIVSLSLKKKKKKIESKSRYLEDRSGLPT
jgi:hypothetical protein